MIHLSDSTAVCTDFTAAAVISDVDRLQQIQEVFQSFSESPIEITREKLNEELQRGQSQAQPLTTTEFNAVMTCLCNAGTASENQTTSRGYADYEFTVNISRTAEVLDQQLIAAASAQRTTGQHSKSGEKVGLVATLPAEIDSTKFQDIDRTHLSLRRLVMDAKSTVRVANPFFDSDQSVVSDLAALPSRGIETRILTREATGKDAQEDTLDTVTKLVKDLENEETELISIRDFYETSEEGYQTGAIHAKTIIVDDTQCYIGSANLTHLNLRENFEFGVLLSGDVVSDVTAIFDTMFEYADPVPI